MASKEIAQRRRQPERNFTILRAEEYHQKEASLSVGDPRTTPKGSVTRR
jgi:hypothetical protein